MCCEHFADALPTADVVVLSDYAKGVLSDAVLHAAYWRRPRRWDAR